MRVVCVESNITTELIESEIISQIESEKLSLI